MKWGHDDIAPTTLLQGHEKRIESEMECFGELEEVEDATENGVEMCLRYQLSESHQGGPLALVPKDDTES